MRYIKIILTACFGLIVFVSASVIYIITSYDNRDYQQLLITTVDRLSCYQLTINGQFDLIRSSNPTLAISGIDLFCKIDGSRILLDKFRIKVELAPLLYGTLLVHDLWVENLHVSLGSGNDEKPFAIAFDFPTLLPIPVIAHAELKNLRLTDADKQIHTLQWLKIASPDRQTPIDIEGKGIFDAAEFTLQGQIGSLDAVFEHSQPYLIDLQVAWKNVSLLVKGHAKEPDDGEGLDLNITLDVPQVAELLSDEIPLQGQLSVRGRILGSLAVPELAKLRLQLRHEQNLQMLATGSIGNLMTLEETEIHLNGLIKEKKWLTRLLPLGSPGFDEGVISSDIQYDGNGLMLRHTRIQLSRGEQLQVEFSGETEIVNAAQPFRNMEIQVQVQANNTGIVNQYLGDILPEMGPVKASADIKTDNGGIFIQAIDALVGQGRNTQLAATGHVGPLLAAANEEDYEINLQLVLNAKHSAQFAELFDIKYPEIGPVAGVAKLMGDSREIKLQDVKLQAGMTDILSIQAEGEISWQGIDTEHPIQTLDYIFNASSTSLQEAFRLYGEELPKLGPAEVSMRVHGQGMLLAGSDLLVRIGTEESLLINATGKIEQINLSDYYHKGIELKCVVKAASTSYLSPLLENQEIPDFGPVHGDFSIHGDSKSLQIPRLRLSAGSKKNLLLRASGKIKRIPLQGDSTPHGVHVELAAVAPNTSNLTALIKHEVPDLGLLNVHALLENEHKNLAINDLMITAGNPQQPTLRIRGEIKNLLSRQGLAMKIFFDETTVVKLFDFRPIPELGKLQGIVVLSDANGSLGIEELKLESEKSELFELKITGSVNDVMAKYDINVNADIAIAAPQLFAKLFAADIPELAPIKASGRLQGSENKAGFKGSLLVGRTRFNSDLRILVANGKPSILGTIISPNFFLRDFAIVPEQQSPVKINKKQSQVAPGPLFSHQPLQLDALRDIDLNLKLTINQLTGTNYQLDKVSSHVQLKNGNLRINPANFTFSGGNMNINAEIDASANPEFKLKIKGHHVQLGDVLAQSHIPPPLEGDLNIVVDLSSVGVSAHEIAANLNGVVGFVLENGKFRKRELDLVFLNPLGWLFSYGISDNEIPISCGLARYRVERGIINSKVFFIEGPTLLIRGKEHINLGKETINSLYNLEKKKFFANTSVPIQISGKLVDPIVEQAPLHSALSKADRYLFAPAAAIPEEVLGTLWSFIGDKHHKQSPCPFQVKQ